VVSAGVGSDLLRGRESDFSFPRDRAQPEKPPLDPLAVLENLIEAALAGPVSYAEILLRPFCRRRLSTFWPSVVRMRMRNPCVLLRLRLLGWNVRFILPGPVNGFELVERDILPDHAPLCLSILSRVVGERSE
jgi:hypothetical protein